MEVLITDIEAEALRVAREEALRVEEEASNAFLAALLKEAEEIKSAVDDTINR